MTRTQNYKILTLDDNNNHEFTDLTKGKMVVFDNKINIDFISIESYLKNIFVLIVTKNKTKDIIISKDKHNNLHIIYDKR